MGWISRLWRSRGHGVHSPFAYRFIREVLCERQPYYAYEHIPSPAQRLLYRVAVFLQPREIAGLGGADISAALMAKPEGAWARPPRWACMQASGMAVAAPGVPVPQLSAHLDRGASVVAFGLSSRSLSELAQAMPSGLIFANRAGLAVILPTPHVPLRLYRLRF